VHGNAVARILFVSALLGYRALKKIVCMRRKFEVKKCGVLSLLHLHARLDGMILNLWQLMPFYYKNRIYVSWYVPVQYMK
jgi:hypothetical protein